METLKVGDLAYYDSFSGMIPCKVESINVQPTSACYVTARITTKRKGTIYNQGELVGSYSRIVPRKAVRFLKHGTFVRAFKIEGEDKSIQNNINAWLAANAKESTK